MEHIIHQTLQTKDQYNASDLGGYRLANHLTLYLPTPVSTSHLIQKLIHIVVNYALDICYNLPTYAQYFHHFIIYLHSPTCFGPLWTIIRAL
jgi:hypothetical protein